jgi:hypothetical protein
MKINKKIIKFSTPSENADIIDLPSSAKKFVPDWYRQSERFQGGKLKIVDGAGNHALKSCVPFLDGLISGYMATLWTDLYVEQTPAGTVMQWRVGPDPASRRNNINPTLPIPHGHEETHYAWRSIFNIETPKGYSCLITHPLNRFDLPFTTLSGVVDTDGVLARGNVPFFLKKDFEGIIPMGTPIFQIIPFKRENWASEKDEALNKKGAENEYNTSRHAYGWYKNFKWNKKSYE